MKYTGNGNPAAPALDDKAGIRSIIADMDWEFSRDELRCIIHNEFFNDANSLDGGLVDAAIARLMLMDGIDLNADTLQRERMIYSILKDIFNQQKYRMRDASLNTRHPALFHTSISFTIGIRCRMQ